jgi:hypothetical protein
MVIKRISCGFSCIGNQKCVKLLLMNTHKTPSSGTNDIASVPSEVKKLILHQMCDKDNNHTSNSRTPRLYIFDGNDPLD